MDKMLTSITLPTPVRDLLSDDPVDIIQFAVDAYRDGPVALATLVDIRGGAARALGSHVAVAADGRFGGYVSGGCVEAAVAFEALLAIAEGKDRTVMFGQGSPFLDIVLPCGGGITVSIHILRDITALRRAVDQVQRRMPASLQYLPWLQTLEVADTAMRAGWSDEQFKTIYRPATRVLISGRNVEATQVGQIARAAGYDVAQVQAFVHDEAIDAFTAVVLLHHDLEAEQSILDKALRSQAFYIGALGSTRTHRKRVDRLRTVGYAEADILRIKAPIGSFGPAKDSTSLALSILSDIAATRLMVCG
jgi:xanthine dehydrogenase accessory factor